MKRPERVLLVRAMEYGYRAREQDRAIDVARQSFLHLFAIEPKPEAAGKGRKGRKA